MNYNLLHINTYFEKLNIKNNQKELKILKKQVLDIKKQAKNIYKEFLEKEGFFELNGKIEALLTSIEKSKEKIKNKENFLNSL